MSKILVKYSDDYSDEFYVDGFVILNKEEFELRMKKIQKYFETHEHLIFYFGTNEFIGYYNFEDFKKSLEVIEITEIEENIINKNIGTNYGIVPYFLYSDEDEFNEFIEEEAMEI